MKKQVDFYISTSEKFEENTPLCLKLIHKAHQHGYNIDVHTDSSEVCQRIDTGLWSLSASSFIPHDIHPQHAQRLQVHATQPSAETVLVNFSSESIEPSDRHCRLLRIVPNQAALVQAAREQYRQFKQQHYTVNTHKIG